VFGRRVAFGLPVNVGLHQGFAAELTITIGQGMLFAATPASKHNWREFPNRVGSRLVKTHTDATIGQHRHPRTPADPAASVEHNALAAIAVQAEAGRNAYHRARRMRVPLHAPRGCLKSCIKVR